MPGTYLPRIWEPDRAGDAPARYQHACHYRSFLPVTLDELAFSLDPVTAGRVAEAEQAIRALNNTDPTPALARLLLRTESVAWSKTEREVRAIMDGMALALADADQSGPWTVSHVRTLHRRLMAGVINARRTAGVVRTSQNWIGGNYWNPCGAGFVPPPPEEVPRLLLDLCKAINDVRLPPLMQAALVHAQFETIHPFGAGNGRTGRALIHVVLRRRGVAPACVPPISIVLARARQGYIDGLTRFRAEGVAEWIGHFAGVAAGAVDLASKYLDELRALTETWRRRLAASPRAPRLDAAAWRIIEILPVHPIITAPVAAAATARSKPQVYQALGQLETAGVLEPVSAWRRNRSWQAAGLPDLLA